MIVKLILVLSLATLSMAKCRRIKCYIKPDSTKNSSNKLHTFAFRTCTTWPDRLDCSRATGRVDRLCKANMPQLSREFITKEICQKVQGDFPPNGLKVPLYLTGKADCAGDADSNGWMDPVKKPDVCCAALPFFGIIGCRSGVDKWCKC